MTLVMGSAAWPEADEERTDREEVLRDLLSGQYSAPIRVVAFNTAEGWSRDGSEDIASEVADLIAIDGRDTPTWLESVIERHGGSRQFSCRHRCAEPPRWSFALAATIAVGSVSLIRKSRG
jgi:hypothetical protein